MLTSRLNLVGAAVLSVMMSAPAGHAQEQTTSYVVSYIEVQPASAEAARNALREYRVASGKEEGSVRVEVLQGIFRPQHFAVLEVWKDNKAREGHTAAASTKQLREKLSAIQTAPYDERPHVGLAVGPAGERGAIYAVTHADFIPPKKDDGIAATKGLSGPSAKDSGNRRYDVLQQANRANHLTLVEVWQDMKSLEAHESAAHTKKYREETLPMSGSLYDQRLYQPIE